MDAVQNNQAPQKGELYVYADYVNWSDENRWELIDGEPYMMASPSFIHQRLVFLFGMQFENFLKGKDATVIISPFDVRLNHTKKDNIVVQPDVIVVCDPKRLENGKSLKGAPDLAIEILSPSTSKRDQLTKFNLYKKSGVREYWIVDPLEKFVRTYILEKDNLGMYYYDEAEKIPVYVLEGCEIDLNQVFEPSMENEPEEKDI